MTPIGSISSQRVDVSPLLERLRMQLAANQFGAQMQQQQQAQNQEFDLSKLRLNTQADQFNRSLVEQQAEREQRGALAKAGQRLQEQENAERATLEREGQALTRRGQNMAATDATAARQERAAATAKQDEAIATAKADKDRFVSEAQAKEDAVKSAVVKFETDVLPMLEQEFGQHRGLQGDELRNAVTRAAKMQVARIFANDPDATMAALDRVNAWEDEQYKRGERERKTAMDKQEMEFKETARKWTEEDRKEARSDKAKADAEERIRKREEADAKILARAYESALDRAVELEKQAVQAEGLGDTATAEKLRADADAMAAKADAMAQKLGFFE